jgi:methyl-accepting chemotaxis protein
MRAARGSASESRIPVPDQYDDQPVIEKRGPMSALVVRLATVAAIALLALVVAAVAIGLMLFMGPVRDAVELTERQTRFVTAVQSAALHAKGIANDERGYFLSQAPEFRTEMAERSVLARRAITDALGAADDVQRPVVVEARAGFERWLAAIEVDIATLDSGDRAAALSASLGPTRGLRKAYEASLAEAQSLGEGGIRTAESAVSDVSLRSVIILLGYLTVAIGIGVLVTTWLVNAVLRPAFDRV